MRKYSKSILMLVFLVLILCMVALFVGCSDNNGGKVPDDNPPEVVPTEPDDPLPDIPRLESPSLIADGLDNVLWDIVDNAVGYVVNLNGTDLPEQTDNVFPARTEEGTYTVKVKAIGDGEHYHDSNYSRPYVYDVVSLTKYSVIKTTSDAYTLIGDDYVTEGDDYVFGINVSAFYEGTPIVTVNGNIVDDINGTYIVENVVNDITISVSGLTHKKVNITYNEIEGVTFVGDTKVNIGEEYFFDIESDKDVLVFYNDNKLVKGGDGKYSLGIIEADVEISLYILDESGFFYYCDTGSVASNAYQAHAEKNYVGVMGTKLLAMSEQAKFICSSTVNFNNGDNVISKFMTTNEIMPTGQGKFEVNSVKYILTDTITGDILELMVKAEAENALPNAYMLIYYNGNLCGTKSDEYFSNFSNVTMNSDWAFRSIPEIKFNALTGSISYCNRDPLTVSDLIGFGVSNPLSVSVELSVRQTGYGIVLNTLCNEELATVATVIKSESEQYTITGANSVNKGETYTFTVEVDSAYEDGYTVLVNGEVVTATAGVYSVANVQSDLYITVKGLFRLTSGNGSVAGNVSQAHAEAGCDGITGTELISTDVGAATFTYGSTVKLNEGDNVIAKFMTTNEIAPYAEGGYEVNSVLFTLTDTVTRGSIGIRIDSMPYHDDGNRPNAYAVIFLGGEFVTIVGDDYISNFSNGTVGSDGAYMAIPEIRYNTTTGDITYCGKTIYNLVGFGTTNPLSVSVEINVKVAGYGVVIDTLCNQ